MMRTDRHHLPMPTDAPDPQPGAPMPVQLADWLLRSPSGPPQVEAYRRSTAELVVGAAPSADPVEPPWWQELGVDWAVDVWLEHHGPATT